MLIDNSKQSLPYPCFRKRAKATPLLVGDFRSHFYWELSRRNEVCAVNRVWYARYSCGSVRTQIPYWKCMDSRTHLFLFWFFLDFNSSSKELIGYRIKLRSISTFGGRGDNKFRLDTGSHQMLVINGLLSLHRRGTHPGVDSACNARYRFLITLLISSTQPTQRVLRKGVPCIEFGK